MIGLEDAISSTGRLRVVVKVLSGVEPHRPAAPIAGRTVDMILTEGLKGLLVNPAETTPGGSSRRNISGADILIVLGFD